MKPLPPKEHRLVFGLLGKFDGAYERSGRMDAVTCHDTAMSARRMAHSYFRQGWTRSGKDQMKRALRWWKWFREDLERISQ